jgi:hypothetical protein
MKIVYQMFFLMMIMRIFKTEPLDFEFSLKNNQPKLELNKTKEPDSITKDNKQEINSADSKEIIKENNTDKTDSSLPSNNKSFTPSSNIRPVLDLSGILQQMLTMNKLNKQNIQKRKKSKMLKKKREIIKLRKKLEREKKERKEFQHQLKELNSPKKITKRRKRKLRAKSRKMMIGGMNDEIQQQIDLADNEYGMLVIQEQANETSLQMLASAVMGSKGLRTKAKGITLSLEGNLMTLTDGIDSICGNHEAMEKQIERHHK